MPPVSHPAQLAGTPLQSSTTGDRANRGARLPEATPPAPVASRSQMRHPVRSWAV